MNGTLTVSVTRNYKTLQGQAKTRLRTTTPNEAKQYKPDDKNDNTSANVRGSIQVIYTIRKQFPKLPLINNNKMGFLSEPRDTATRLSSAQVLYLPPTDHSWLLNGGFHHSFPFSNFLLSLHFIFNCPIDHRGGILLGQEAEMVTGAQTRI
jgi:hypothetical protein